MTNSADRDQLASSDLHCLLRQGMSCSAREGLSDADQNIVFTLNIWTYKLEQTVDSDQMQQNVTHFQNHLNEVILITIYNANFLGKT